MHSGYRGRTSIHELFDLNDSIRRVIQSGADAGELHHAARQQGMFTLYEDGLRKVAAGQSSLEEVLRVTQDQRDDASVDAQSDRTDGQVSRLQSLPA
jgi:general secretion pathway protein E